MQMKNIIITTLLICISIRLHADNDDFCGANNTAFQSGENVTYHVYYTLAGVYVMGGEASFTTSIEQLGGRPVYHIIGQGKTNSFFDGIFKVRDRYDSYIDTASLQPLKFIRNISEGKFQKTETIKFNKATNTATSNKGTYKVPNCVQDVISTVYYARNIRFNKYKVNDKIPFDLFVDDEVYHLYIRYLGKEKLRTKFGKFNAIKFKPLLVKGSSFSGGEQMTVWVTDDANHLPIRIESGISVGSINVDMMNYRGLRHTMSAFIDF